MTSGFRDLPTETRHAAFRKIRLFKDFSASSDPYGEHDFGCVEEAGERIYFKIDYYDPALTTHSEDASDPTKTVRVMTVMLAHEY